MSESRVVYEALPRSFYRQGALASAQALLNCILVRESDAGLVSGRISETEAYTPDDPASHSYRGKTARNKTMFGPPGYAYVYFTYGTYHCLNAVTSDENDAEAVLIRAVEPIDGWELMSRRRGLPEEEIGRLSESRSDAVVRARWGRALTGGPGKLCMAYDLTLADDGLDLTTGRQLWIAPPTAGNDAAPYREVVASPRIGIRHSVELLQRFTLRGDPYVSKAPKQI
jgi:DNA-3-methyladenine glycosylase